MFGCGLGKQKPYAHSGKRGRGREKLRQRKQIYASWLLQGSGNTAANKAGSFHLWLQVWNKAGRCWYGNSSLTAETEPLAGTQEHQAPAVAQVWHCLGIHIQGLWEVGTLYYRNVYPQTKWNFPVSLSPFYYFPCGYSLSFKNVVLKCVSLSGHIDFSVAHRENTVW